MRKLTYADVVVVGAGLSGICAAIKLRERFKNEKDFTVVVLESAPQPGGTWYHNKYPGCACDVPMIMYSFSFDMCISNKPYEDAAVIHDYLENVCKKYGLRPNVIQCGAKVGKSEFDENKGLWGTAYRLSEDNNDAQATMSDDGSSSNGDEYDYLIISKFLISATGLLNLPSYPSIPGLSSLIQIPDADDISTPGPRSWTARAIQSTGDSTNTTSKMVIMHTAEWDETIDLRNKTVAVIGNGASGIQVVEAAAPQVKKLLLFQRSPKWFLDPPTLKNPTFLMKTVPGFARFVRLTWFVFTELLNYMLSAGEKTDRLIKFIFCQSIKQHMLQGKSREEVEQLSKKIIPTFSPGCNRLLVNKTYLDAIQRPNVSVISDGIVEIVPNGIVTKSTGPNGEVVLTTHEADVVVFATGFRIRNCLPRFAITGRGGVTLEQQWGTGNKRDRESSNTSSSSNNTNASLPRAPLAYLGITTPNFPNAFFIYGPNTNPICGSVTFYVECACNYIANAIAHTRKISPDACLEVKTDVVLSYNQRLCRWFKSRPELTGCSAWYLQGSRGTETAESSVIPVSTTNFPGSMIGYWWLTRVFKPTDFVFRVSSSS